MTLRFLQDFPGGPGVKNLPAKAGDMGSIPGRGRFHMPQGSKAPAPQLLKPVHLRAELRNQRSTAKKHLCTAARVAAAPAPRESPCAAMEIQSSQNENKYVERFLEALVTE